MKKLLLAATFFMFAFALFADITITDKGISNHVIVIPDKCSGYVQSAVYDMQNILQQITGVKLPVKKESTVSAGTLKISVGDTNFAKQHITFAKDASFEEMAIKTLGKNIIITGKSDTGICFAIYDFLENQCGCRWYDNFNIKIPRKETLVVRDVNMQRAPSFIFRRIFTMARNTKKGDKLGALRLKATYNSIPRRPMGRPSDVHSMYQYTKNWPKEKLYLLSKNPNGRRNAQKGTMGPNTCVTHPEAVALYKQQLRKFIEQDRADSRRNKTVPPTLYNISINDCSDYFCYCDSCQKVVKKHGEAGLLIHFINMLADDIAKDYPDIIIHTCAYSFTAPPPKTDIKARPNVAVELAHNSGNFYAPVAEDTKGKFAEDVKNWGSRTNMLGIWDYWIFYWDVFPAPYHNVHQIKKDLEFYHKNGVRTMRIESEGFDKVNFFNLKHWLGYKLMDDLNQDADALIAEYMNDYYGPAAPEMKEFMDYVAERQKGSFSQVFREKFNPKSRPWLDKTFYTRVQAIFDRAEAKCKPGSMHLKNVHRERIPVDLSLLYLYDEIKPEISRKDLAERYRAYAHEFIKLRKVPSSHDAEMLLVNNEAEKYLRAEEIEAMKNGPKPSWEISKNWSKQLIKYETTGIPAKRDLSVEAKRENDILYLRFTEYNFDTKKLKTGKRTFTGDDWEFFLASERNSDYVQFLVDPKGRCDMIYSHNGKAEDTNFKGVKIKSTLEPRKWILDVTIPLKSLPLKNIRYANFFRGIKNGGCSWSPTFSKSYHNFSVLGELIFK